MNNKGLEKFREISRWKLEANLEDNDRYFYITPEIELLLTGEKSFVIGRKGTGKTAIANFIKKNTAHDKFSVDLTLKNFPFNQLYTLKDGRFTSPNEYITIWKYIIYSNIMYLMNNNEAIDPDLRTKISRTILVDPSVALSQKVSEWTSANLSVGFQELSAGLGIGKSTQESNLSWIERTQILESIIVNHLDDSSYYILFDELDEDYRYQSALDGQGQYLDLISGLFKAVQEIKSICLERKLQINPIIFLRNDIYSLIQNPDKTKWSDFIVELSWTKYTIQPLIAHRLTRAINQDQKPLSFKKAWESFFSSEKIRIGRRRDKATDIFDWISNNTLLRPRDFIKFIQLCGKKAVESGYTIIKPGTVTTQDLLFSNYLRSELVDEIHSVIPEINDIFNIISKIGKQNFAKSEFSEIYERDLRQRSVSKFESGVILNILFTFSVIGNHCDKTNRTVFRHKNPNAEFNEEQAIVVHRGLQKSLQLF